MRILGTESMTQSLREEGDGKLFILPRLEAHTRCFLFLRRIF